MNYLVVPEGQGHGVAGRPVDLGLNLVVTSGDFNRLGFTVLEAHHLPAVEEDRVGAQPVLPSGAEAVHVMVATAGESNWGY